MNKPVILTGLRANNDLHIGNYFGALLPLIDMATKKAGQYQINLFVPDLHSFTTPIDHSLLQANILHNVKLFAAAGLPLDDPDIYVYRQSYIPAHSELTWILDCFTDFGTLRRMTQFRDKSGITSLLQGNYQAVMDFLANATEHDPAKKIANLEAYIEAEEASRIKNMSRQDSVTVGLFNYPVLMAADILLYGAKYVPVGEDQTQHLEFTRDIAERMNARFGELLTVPEPVPKQHEFFGKDQGLRIKDLQDPSKKMSKSDETGKGIIFLGDSPDEAAKKVMGATTDSVGSVHLDYDNQPGIANLLQILALLTDQPLADVAAEHDGQQRYGEFKAEVAEAVRKFILDFQTRLEAVNEEALYEKLVHDERHMNTVAGATLLRIQKAVGLRA